MVAPITPPVSSILKLHKKKNKIPTLPVGISQDVMKCEPPPSVKEDVIWFLCEPFRTFFFGPIFGQMMLVAYENPNTNNMGAIDIIELYSTQAHELCYPIKNTDIPAIQQEQMNRRNTFLAKYSFFYSDVANPTRRSVFEILYDYYSSYIQNADRDSIPLQQLQRIYNQINTVRTPSVFYFDDQFLNDLDSSFFDMFSFALYLFYCNVTLFTAQVYTNNSFPIDHATIQRQFGTLKPFNASKSAAFKVNNAVVIPVGTESVFCNIQNPDIEDMNVQVCHPLTAVPFDMFMNSNFYSSTITNKFS